MTVESNKFILKSTYRALTNTTGLDRHFAARQSSRALTSSNLDTGAIQRDQAAQREEELRRIDQFMTENQEDTSLVQYICKKKENKS